MIPNGLLPIPGLRGYMVGPDGSVWSFVNWRGKPGHKISAHPDRNGYLRIRVYTENGVCGKQVHRLVCSAFHGPQTNRLHQVRHLNGIKTDNRPKNLAWGTAKENARDRDVHGTTARGERNGWSELTREDVLAVRCFRKHGMPSAIMAAYLCVSETTVHDAAAGTTYREVQCG